jgi:hypothetical protein
MELSELLARLIAVNGGEIVGKTRLQKTIYLLDKLGLHSGCDYEYHYYGPFSAQVAEAADDATLNGELLYEERPGFHSVPYGIYRARSLSVPPNIGALPSKVVSSKLEIMRHYSALELELAATIVFLRDDWFVDDAVRETIRRKPIKADPDRIRRAEQLISELGL